MKKVMLAWALFLVWACQSQSGLGPLKAEEIFDLKLADKRQLAATPSEKKSADSLFLLAQNAWRRSEKASVFAIEALRLNPGPDSYFLLGKSLLQDQKNADALKAFQAAIYFNHRESGVVWGAIADCFARQNQTDSAMYALKKMFLEKQVNWQVLSNDPIQQNQTLKSFVSSQIANVLASQLLSDWAYLKKNSIDLEAEKLTTSQKEKLLSELQKVTNADHLDFFAKDLNLDQVPELFVNLDSGSVGLFQKQKDRYQLVQRFNAVDFSVRTNPEYFELILEANNPKRLTVLHFEMNEPDWKKYSSYTVLVNSSFNVQNSKFQPMRLKSNLALLVSSEDSFYALGNTEKPLTKGSVVIVFNQIKTHQSKDYLLALMPSDQAKLAAKLVWIQSSELEKL